MNSLNLFIPKFLLDSLCLKKYIYKYTHKKLKLKKCIVVELITSSFRSESIMKIKLVYYKFHICPGLYKSCKSGSDDVLCI